MLFLRLKCEKEISEWVNHVIRQVDLAGKDLLEEMKDMMQNKLEAVVEHGPMASIKNISFVPNVMLEWSNLGFLAIDNVLPTDFHLDIVTLLQNVQVGQLISVWTVQVKNLSLCWDVKGSIMLLSNCMVNMFMAAH